MVGGKVRSFDASRALAIPGVEQVVELAGSIPPAKFAPLGGIAVVASNTDAAIKGRDALEIDWDHGPHGDYNSAAFMAEMRKTAGKPGKVLREEGDVDAAFASAAKSFVREYTQAHLVHAPMEPLAAVASVTRSGAELWAPVQSPSAARQDVAAALGMDTSDVKMNVTLLGGGFGRKSKCDDVIEAALISQKIGAPVKIQWTREDDIRHSFNHTTSVERIQVALDHDDRVVAWRHNSVAPSILSDLRAGQWPSVLYRVRHGACRYALRGTERALREWQGDGAYADRLVPCRLEHSACLGDPVLCRGAGCGTG